MAPRRKFEEIVQDLKNEGLDDLAEELGEYSGSTLRRKLEEAETELARIPDLENTIKGYETGAKVKDALAGVDVDYENLSKAERIAIEKSDVDFDDEEAVRGLVTELELVAAPADAGTKDKTEAEKVVDAAKGAPQKRSASQTTITPVQANEWSMEEMQTFRANHPQEWEQLKRGNEVVAPA